MLSFFRLTLQLAAELLLRAGASDDIKGAQVSNKVDKVVLQR